MMINQFLDYLRYERNTSPLTVQTYEESLRDFESYVTFRDKELSISSVDTDLIRDWMESLMDKGNSASTINKKLSALRSFYRFALKRQLVKTDPAHAVIGPKKSKPLPQFLREGEMYEAGLRRAELVSLNDKDVDFDAAQLKVTGKRNKQRIVPFGAELAEALKQYQTARNEQFGETGGALFLSDKGQRISDSQVYQIVKKYLSMVTSLKKRSPHVLRHTFATAMLNNGAGLETIKSLLGHASVSTTEIYTHTTFEQLKRIYKEAHPRA